MIMFVSYCRYGDFVVSVCFILCLKNAGAVRCCVYYSFDFNFLKSKSFTLLRYILRPLSGSSSDKGRLLPSLHINLIFLLTSIGGIFVLIIFRRLCSRMWNQCI